MTKEITCGIAISGYINIAVDKFLCKKNRNLSAFFKGTQDFLAKIRLPAAKKNSCFQGTKVSIIDISW